MVEKGIFGMNFVYLVRAGEGNYKVGVTSNVVNRLRALQTSNSNLIEVVTAKPIMNAYEVEQQLHQRLNGLKSNGGKEWFRLQPNDALEIAVVINRMPSVDISNKLSMAMLLENQKSFSKSLDKKLDFIINVYQKENKPVATIEPEVFLPVKPTKEELDNEIHQRAIEIIRQEGRASTSLLQRKLNIGYGRASRIIDKLEEQGIIGQADGAKAREVLVSS